MQRKYLFFSPDDGSGSGAGDQTPPENQPDNDYIEQIKKLKASTVSKEEYDKLNEEKKKLLQALVDGEQIDAPGDKDKKTSDELIKEAQEGLFKNDGHSTNLEEAKRIITLYEENMKKGNCIFLPNSKNYKASSDDIATAERVYEGLKHCVEYADGDPDNFQAEFVRITKDTPGFQNRNFRR